MERPVVILRGFGPVQREQKPNAVLLHKVDFLVIEQNTV